MKKEIEIPQFEVELEWLKAELYNRRYDHVRRFLRQSYDDYFIESIESPPAQMEKAIYRHTISLMLWMERGKLLSLLPKNTKWFETKLTIKEFGKLQVISESSWYDGFVKVHRIYRVRQIAKHMLLLLRNSQYYNLPSIIPEPHARKIAEIYKGSKKHEFKEKLILLKATKSKEISILEGNHRAIAMYMRYLTKKISPPKNFLIGISPNMKTYRFYDYKYWIKNNLK